RRHLAKALETGVKQPLSRVATALNLSFLVKWIKDKWLKGLLSGGTSSAKVAAVVTVATVSLAGGGVVLGETVGSRHHHRTPPARCVRDGRPPRLAPASRSSGSSPQPGAPRPGPSLQARIHAAGHAACGKRRCGRGRDSAGCAPAAYRHWGLPAAICASGS